MDEFFNDWQLNPPATSASVDEELRKIGFSLPDDYVQLLKTFNGGEGFLGEDYLILWAVEDLLFFNKEYEVQEYAPGIFLFGSSGGGDGYGFDTTSVGLPVVRLPFIGMSNRYADVVADNVPDLLEKLSSNNYDD